MQRQRIETTKAILMQTGEFQQGAGHRAGWIGLGVLSSKEFNDGQSSKRYD